MAAYSQRSRLLLLIMVGAVLELLLELCIYFSRSGWLSALRVKAGGRASVVLISTAVLAVSGLCFMASRQRDIRPVD